MDAEYGRSLGGAINILTKSGGNEFEGQAMVVYSHPEMQSFLAPTLDGDSTVGEQYRGVTDHRSRG